VVRKSGLTLREEIILHLFSQPPLDSDIEGPYAATREGISRALGIKPSQLSRDLKPLISGGYVAWKTVHVLGFKKRVRGYTLSEKGRKTAESIIQSLRDLSITVIDEFGNPETTSLEHAVKKLGGRYSYLEILRMRDKTTDGEIRIASPVQFPIPKRFIGREKELKMISEWYTDKTSDILFIYGIAGVGKTSLVMKFISSLKDVPKFYFKLHEWDTQRGILELIANALAGWGDEKLQSYLKNTPYEDLNNISIILRITLTAGKPLLIFDDIWTVSKKIQPLITMICETVSSSGGKMILISREFPSYFEGYVNLQASITKIKLEGLTEDEARQLLREKGLQSMPGELMDELINALKGHPLLLTLLQGNEDIDALCEGDIARFIHNEVISRLSPEEKKLLHLLSVFRGPIPISLLVRKFGFETVDSLQRKAIIEKSGQNATLHDLMRSFSLAMISEKERRECHQTAYRLLPPEDEYLLERIYHAINGGLLDTAFNEIKNEKEKIITSGRVSDLLILIEGIPQRDLPAAIASEILHLKVLGYTHQGKISKAIECYERASPEVSSSPEVILITADNYILEGSYKKARDMLRSLNRRGLDIQLSIEKERIYGRLFVARGLFEQAKKRYMKALTLAKKSDSREIMAEVMMDLATVSLYKGETRNVINQLLGAMRLLRGDDSRLARIYHNLSIAYYQQKMNDQALLMLERALGIYKRSGDYITVIKLLLNKSAIFYEEERMHEAREVILEALELSRRAGVQRFVAASMANLSMVDNMLKNYVEAEVLAKEALRIAKTLKDNRITVSLMNSLALSSLGQCRIDDAISYAKNGLTLGKKIGAYNMCIDLLETLSLSYMIRKDYTRARIYARRALSLAIRKGVIHALKRIEKIVKRLGEKNK